MFRLTDETIEKMVQYLLENPAQELADALLNVAGWTEDQFRRDDDNINRLFALIGYCDECFLWTAMDQLEYYEDVDEDGNEFAMFLCPRCAADNGCGELVPV